MRERDELTEKVRLIGSRNGEREREGDSDEPKHPALQYMYRI